MIEVGKEGTIWFDLFDVLESFVQTEMGRVWFDPDTIQDKDVETLQSGDRLLRNKIQIRRVCKVVEAIRDHRQLAVDHFERRNFQAVADAKRRVRIDRVRDQLGQAAAKMNRFEYVLENPPEIDPRDLVRKDRHRAKAEVERPYVIESEDVIDVTVGDENRVDPLDLRPQRLLAKIDRCIDEDLVVIVLNEYRDP